MMKIINTKYQNIKKNRLLYSIITLILLISGCVGTIDNELINSNSEINIEKEFITIKEFINLLDENDTSLMISNRLGVSKNSSIKNLLYTDEIITVRQMLYYAQLLNNEAGLIKHMKYMGINLNRKYDLLNNVTYREAIELISLYLGIELAEKDVFDNKTATDMDKAINYKEAHELIELKMNKIFLHASFKANDNYVNELDINEKIIDLEFLIFKNMILSGFFEYENMENYNGIDIIKIINNNTLAVIRMYRYGMMSGQLEQLFWSTVAGNMNEEIADIFISNESMNEEFESPSVVANDEVLMAKEELIEISKQVAKTKYYNDPVDKVNIDFVHMVAVIDCIYSDISANDDIEIFIDYFTGWGGDLLTFLSDVQKKADHNEISDKKDYEKYISETLGTKEKSNFSEEDLLADIDAVNITAVLNKEKLLLSEGVIWYYGSRDVYRRYNLFVDSFGGQEEFLKTVKILVYNKSITENELVAYRVKKSDLGSVFMLFEELFMYREGTEIELKSIYEGFTQLIISRLID